MSKLGDVVIYTVPTGHETSTLARIAEKIEETLLGSIHHPEMREFAAIVGNVNIDGTCDLQLLVPNKEPRWADAVPEGTGPGSFAQRPLTLATVAPDDLAAAVAAAELAKSSAVEAASSASAASVQASNAAGSASAASMSWGAAKAAAEAANTSASDALSAAEKAIGAITPAAA